MIDKWSDEYVRLMDALDKETPEERAEAYKERALRDRIEFERRSKEMQRLELVHRANIRDMTRK